MELGAKQAPAETAAAAVQKIDGDKQVQEVTVAEAAPQKEVVIKETEAPKEEAAPSQRGLIEKDTKVAKHKYQFVNDEGKPRQVKISHSVTWDPKDQTCQVDGCTNVAYNQCDAKLQLGFPSSIGMWNGCGKFHCIHHTYFRPNILDKPVFRCRSKRCNSNFYQTLRRWQNTRCVMLTMVAFIPFVILTLNILIENNDKPLAEYFPAWLGWIDFIALVTIPYAMKHYLSRPYSSNRRKTTFDGMDDIYIVDQVGFYDFNCCDDGQNVAVVSGGTYGGSHDFGDAYDGDHCNAGGGFGGDGHGAGWVGNDGHWGDDGGDGGGGD